MAVDQRANAKPGGSGGTSPGGADQGLKRTSNFIEETIVELKKTTWPTREMTLRLTGVVIVVILVLSLYMAGLDYVLTAVVSRFSLIK